MKNFIERVHILDYAVLGWLTGRDLLKKTRPISIVAALIFCSTVGILDELFQLCLPYRVCDWRDMVFNSLGASLGIILWLINNR
jgi:VanZ family protein